MRFDDSKLVVLASAGLTAWAGTRYGLTAMIPAVGPVGAPIATIALGVVLVTMLRAGGTLGQVVEGVGYGLVAVGALELTA